MTVQRGLRTSEALGEADEGNGMVLCSWEQETSVGHAVCISPEKQLVHLTRAGTFWLDCRCTAGFGETLLSAGTSTKRSPLCCQRWGGDGHR